MEIANSQSHDRLVIDGHASLDGALELTFRELPSVGDVFDLIEYGSSSGGFRDIVLPSQIRVEFKAATGELVVTAIAPEPSVTRLLLLCFGIIGCRKKPFALV
jgi:hypothetical protein